MVKTIKPISRIAKIEEEINRIIGEVFYRKEDYFGLDEGWVPCIDIYERDNKITIETELPGVTQRDIIILLHSNRIEIRGRKKENLPSSKFRYLRLEREFGNFRRIISLPHSVVPEKTKATLVNGILTIELRKMRRKEDKEVKVKIQKPDKSTGGN
ncbi:MAG: Hsp20 family protein [Candidatus Aminicenantes bacterium]|nr:Hsp20 family protein [Candidatus Aminicenantes bacterium]